MPEPVPIPPAGVTIPDHELLRVIGRGSYGEVWLARSALGELRAVKLVRRDGHHDDRPFEREFAGLQKFEPISRSHEGLVHILHAGRFDGGFFYVMELADDGSESRLQPAGASDGLHAGIPPAPHRLKAELQTYSPRTLRSELRACGRLPAAECLDLALKLTDALAHLHGHGLVHRDLKPSNIIFVRGQPKLADIGLVASADASMSCVGTEGYLPPEGPGKPPADLYALGKVLYELATGRDRTDFPELPTLLRDDPQREALEEFNEIILKACEPEARRRYQTAAEMRADLLLMQSGRSLRAARTLRQRLVFARRAGALVGAAALLMAAAYLLQKAQTHEARRLKQVAEDHAVRWQIQNAENLFARGDSPEALAQLARVLRQDPGNRVAAERLLSALARRNFPRPVAPSLPHPQRVWSAAFSPDARQIVTLCRDHRVRFWDALTGRESLPPSQHTGSVNSAAFSPDGRRVVTASGDKTAQVLDARTGQLAYPPLPHDGAVNAAGFSPQGDLIATASGDRQARIHDAATGRLRHPPLSHEGEVVALAFHPAARWLATAAEDRGVRLWDAASGRLDHHLRLEGSPNCVRFSQDGRWLAASFQHDTNYAWQVQVWDLEASPPQARTLPHENRLYALAFSPDGRRLAVATANNAARVWDLATGKLQFQLPHSAQVYAVEFSPDGRHLLTASVDQTARLWDAATGTPASEAMRHDDRVVHAEFSRDGSRVLTASWDRSVRVWDVRPVRPAEPAFAHSSPVLVAEFDADSGQVLTATGRASFTASRNNRWGGRDPQAAFVRDAAPAKPSQALTLPTNSGIITARFTRAGPRALVAEQNFTSATAMAADHEFSSRAQIWDVSTQQPVGAPLRHEHDINCASFNADGAKLAAGTTRGIVRLWDTRSGTPLTPPLSHPGWINSVRFNETGTRLVSASREGTAMVWDAATGARVAGPLAHGSEVWFAQFSPHGDKLVTVSTDNSAKIWAATGELVAELPHGSPVEHAEFSPDGDRLVTASGLRARLWSVSTGRQLIGPLTHDQLVLAARFSADGLRVITASYDGTALVWDAATGLKLAEPFGHADEVLVARFSPDARRAVTASYDGIVKIWEMPSTALPVPSWLPELAEAVAGQRLNANDVSEPVGWAEHAALRSRLASPQATDPPARWALELLAGPLPDTKSK